MQSAGNSRVGDKPGSDHAPGYRKSSRHARSHRTRPVNHRILSVFNYSDTPVMTRAVKVAVVGSGLAGLTAAHLLSTPRENAGDNVEFEVHLFERAASLGMDAASVSVQPKGEKSGEWRVDVPMRSFQGGYYPNLIALYKHLGVAFHPANFSYSFSTYDSRRNASTSFIYNGSSGLAGVSLPSFLAPHKAEPFYIHASSLGYFALSILIIVIHYARLLVLSISFMRPAQVKTMSFREWARAAAPTSWTRLGASWDHFVEDILVPLFSAICTAPAEDVWEHPVEEFLDYVILTLFTQHYVVTAGVQDVVKRLTVHATESRVHLSSPITRVAHTSSLSGVPSLSIECGAELSEQKTFEGFSHVIFATEANTAAAILRTYSASLTQDSAATNSSATQEAKRISSLANALGTILYRPSIVINHTDPALLPDALSDRRELNLFTCSSPSSFNNGADISQSKLCLPPTYTMATHIRQAPSHHLPGPYSEVYQTTNPIVPIDPERVLSIARLQRAVLTCEAKQAIAKLFVPNEMGVDLGPLQKKEQSDEAGKAQLTMPGVWVCGSYASGIPLLEGCVVSARAVVQEIWTSEGVDAKNAWKNAGWSSR